MRARSPASPRKETHEDLRREGHPQRPAGRTRRRGQDHAAGGDALRLRRRSPAWAGSRTATRVSDFEAEETKKGISVSLAMAPIEWNGVEDQRPRRAGVRGLHRRRALRDPAVDAVLLVVSAVDGVEVQTEVAWELAVEAGLPRAIIINKLDRERASFERTLGELVQAFGNQVAPLELPLGEEHDFEGVCDLLLAEGVPLRRRHRPASRASGPTTSTARPTRYREKLVEAVAESDDALIERYLEEGSLPEDVVDPRGQARVRRGHASPPSCAPSASQAARGRPRRSSSSPTSSPRRSTAARSLAPTKDGEEVERDMRPERPAHRARLQDGVGSLRRPHHDVPRLLGHVPARRVRAQRHEEHRRAGRPALHAPRQGARRRQRGPGRRHRRRREAHAHRRRATR